MLARGFSTQEAWQHTKKLRFPVVTALRAIPVIRSYNFRAALRDRPLRFGSNAREGGDKDSDFLSAGKM